MMLVVWKKYLGSQILYRSLVPSKKRRHILLSNGWNGRCSSRRNSMSCHRPWPIWETTLVGIDRHYYRSGPHKFVIGSVFRLYFVSVQDSRQRDIATVLIFLFKKIIRRPFGTALRAFASISLKFHSKMLPKKKSITLAAAAVRHGRPSAT